MMSSALLSLKFMKFMNLNEQLSFLWRVIGHAKWELLAFLVVFLLILTAFALLFSMLLGAQGALADPASFCGALPTKSPVRWSRETGLIDKLSCAQPGTSTTCPPPSSRSCG